MTKRYCIDASSLIRAGKEAYPRDTFPAVWEKLEALIETGRLISADEIKEELKRQDDDLFDWAKAHSKMFVPADEPVQRELAGILASHPNLVDVRKNRSGGDPWLIAVAKVTGAVVVTEESLTGSIKKPKIPDVCAAVGVPYTNLLGMIKAEGWMFA